MIQKRLAGLRVTLLAALALGTPWACGGEAEPQDSTGGVGGASAGRGGLGSDGGRSGSPGSGGSPATGGTNGDAGGDAGRPNDGGASNGGESGAGAGGEPNVTGGNGGESTAGGGGGGNGGVEGQDGGSGGGRPFLVEGQARRAQALAGEGWAVPQGADPSELTHAERQAICEHWTELGLMEHASVAAFARFALQLLSLAAPAELLSATQGALSDEIEHAELCFGLASDYGGRTVRPGALALRDALTPDQSWPAIVRTAMLEACIGETVAVAEAEAALSLAREPAVRRVLRRIVEDEARHAELGWRFVHWALSQVDAPQRDRVVAELFAKIHERLAATKATAPGVLEASRLVAHGLLPERARRAAQHAALVDVVLPCASALRDELSRLAA